MRYNEKLPVPCIYLLRLDRISDWPDIHAYLISFIWLSVVYNYKEDQVTITRKMLTCIFCSTLFYNWKKAGYLFPTNFQLFLLPCCVLNSGQLLYPPTSTGENSHLGQLREFFKINFIQAKSVFIFFNNLFASNSVPVPTYRDTSLNLDPNWIRIQQWIRIYIPITELDPHQKIRK